MIVSHELRTNRGGNRGTAKLTPERYTAHSKCEASATQRRDHSRIHRRSHDCSLRIIAPLVLHLKASDTSGELHRSSRAKLTEDHATKVFS